MRRKKDYTEKIEFWELQLKHFNSLPKSRQHMAKYNLDRCRDSLAHFKNAQKLLEENLIHVEEEYNPIQSIIDDVRRLEKFLSYCARNEVPLIPESTEDGESSTPYFREIADGGYVISRLNEYMPIKSDYTSVSWLLGNIERRARQLGG